MMFRLGWFQRMLYWGTVTALVVLIGLLGAETLGR